MSTLISYLPHKNEFKVGHRPKCKAKAIKLLKENMGENLGAFGFGKYFL